MSSKRTQRRLNRRAADRGVVLPLALLLLPLCIIFVMVDLVSRSVTAQHAHESAQLATSYLTNDGLQQFVTDFFTEYDAVEMIPIIACESEFKQYNDDGTVLKNKQGSSATGISQIMASVHPDPQVITKYNRRNHTHFTVADFDINTISGNLWYALVLYKVRGTRDWECAR